MMDAAIAEYVSLEDAARAIGKRTETLKAWWRAGEFTSEEFRQLPARRGRGNAYAVDLVAARRIAEKYWTPPRHAVALSSSSPPPITVIERGAQTRPAHIARTPSPTVQRPARAMPPARLPGAIPTLPATWRSMNSVSMRHGLKKSARKQWVNKMQAGTLRVQRGKWMQGDVIVEYACDEEGQDDFARAFGHLPWWTACGEDECRTCIAHQRLFSQHFTNPTDIPNGEA